MVYTIETGWVPKMSFPQDLARALDPDVAECLRLLEACANAGRGLTLEERQKCYDALNKIGWFRNVPA